MALALNNVNRRQIIILLVASLVLVGVFFQVHRASRARQELIAEEAEITRTFIQQIKSRQESDRCVITIGQSTVGIDDAKVHMLRRDLDGKIEWLMPLGDKFQNDSQPSLATDGQLVFARLRATVRAYDAATGRLVWLFASPTDCFCLSGNLLLLVKGSQVVALATALGTEAFRLNLPSIKEFKPIKIEETTGLFLVQSLNDDGESFVFDRSGKIWHHLLRQTIKIVTLKDDRLFLTNTDLQRITADDKTIWRIPFEFDERFAGGTIERTNDEFFVAILYCRIANSGVQAIQFNSVTGDIRWRARCFPLSKILHSEYSQDATVQLVGEHLWIISHGSSGSFAERLDSKTGRLIHRSEKRKW